MRRTAVALVAVAVLAGCSSEPDTVDVETYNEAVAVGPFADWDQEALDSLGESACVDIREHGMTAFAQIIETLEDEGLSSDEATRATSAFVVRFCPETAG